jgi:HPt (histidine-containing phosphotransfer) domain-containing protein
VNNDSAESDAQKALQDLIYQLRVSMTAILTHAAALRDADSRNAPRAERAALLDAIQREGSYVVQRMDSVLNLAPAAPTPVQGSPSSLAEAGSTREETRPSQNRPKTSQAHKAYIGWLRSRMEQIETLSQTGDKQQVGQLALQLKDSAASMGFVEISHAAAAVHRLAESDGPGFEAALEILRRIVSRAIRKVDAA